MKIHYGDVKYKEICDLLDLEYFGSKKITNHRSKHLSKIIRYIKV